jgi:hypothetical protein
MKKLPKSHNEEEDTLIKINKEFWIALAIIAVCIIVAVIIAMNSKDAGKFEYKGVIFKKEYTGEILFYTAYIPVFDKQDRIEKVTTIDFRNDPRTLDIKLDFTGRIKLLDDKQIYVSYGELEQCEDNGIAAINLGRFLSNGGVNVKGATMDKNLSTDTTPYVTCETHANNTVIEIKKGSETALIHKKENCYELTYKNCKILQATEKFELILLEQYMKDVSKK